VARPSIKVLILDYVNETTRPNVSETAWLITEWDAKSNELAFSFKLTIFCFDCKPEVQSYKS
jgi:hypothetical protein